MCLASMSVSKQYWLFIQMVELLVSSSIQEMVFPTLYQSMKDMQSPMLYRGFILQEETSQTIFRSCSTRGVIHSPLMLKLRSSKISRKECVLLSTIMRPLKRMPRKAIMSRRIMNYPMEERSLLEKKGSRQLRFSSSHKRRDLISRVSTNIAMTQ